MTENTTAHSSYERVTAEDMDRTDKFDLWHCHASEELQSRAKTKLLQCDDPEAVLKRFFENYSLAEISFRGHKSVVGYLLESMPPEPEIFYVEDHAENVLDFLDRLRAPEPALPPVSEMPELAQACIDMAMAYLKLAQRINRNDLSLSSPENEAEA